LCNAKSCLTSRISWGKVVRKDRRCSQLLLLSRLYGGGQCRQLLGQDGAGKWIQQGRFAYGCLSQHIRADSVNHRQVALNLTGGGKAGGVR